MSARDIIADRLWVSLPSSDDAEAHAVAEQMLDAYRAEILREAADIIGAPGYNPSSANYVDLFEGGVYWAEDKLRGMAEETS